MGRVDKKKKGLNYRGIIFIIAIILIIVCVVLVVAKKDNNKDKIGSGKENIVTTEEDDYGNKTNISEELQKEKTFFGYQISNVSLKEVEGENTFTAKLKNVTQNVIGDESLHIVFKSTTGEELYKMQVYVTKIQPGKSIDINSVITKDIIESYELEIVK